MRRSLSICLILFAAFASAQPFPASHAHNDYEHKVPLFDALKAGATSIEADIHISSDRILVSHGRPGKKAKTLEELYLRPLDSIVKANKGKVYPGYDGPFILMIDIKTDGDEALPALKELLRPYQSMIAAKAKPGAVTILLSGNRPTVRDPDGWLGLDGRPKDLGAGYPLNLMPVISDRYPKWCSWNGRSTPPPGALDKIKTLALRVHMEGRRLRLWAIPDSPNAWKELLAAGVDIINTDHPAELGEFLRK